MQTSSGTGERVEEFSKPPLGNGVHGNRRLCREGILNQHGGCNAGRHIFMHGVFVFTGILRCFFFHVMALCGISIIYF